MRSHCAMNQKAIHPLPTTPTNKTSIYYSISSPPKLYILLDSPMPPSKQKETLSKGPLTPNTIPRKSGKREDPLIAT